MARPPESFLPKPVGASWLMHDPLGFFQHHQQRYGDVFVLSFGTGLRRTAWVCDARLADQVLTAPTGELEAAGPNSILEPIVGNGSLLLLGGDEHVERRRLLAGEFDQSHLDRASELITQVARSHMASLTEGTVVGLWDWARDLTMEVMLRVVFGLERPHSEPLAEALSELVELSGSPPIFFRQLRVNIGPDIGWGRFLRCRATVDRLILRQIAERRAHPRPDADDILSLAVRAKYRDGRTLSDSDIRDEAVTLMIAGKETVASGLSWTIDLLLRNPPELARVRDEVRARGDDEVRAGGNPRLEAAIHEALRLRAPLFGVGRGAMRDYRLDRFTIPAGMAIAIPLLLVFRSTKLFTDPTLFKPDRYLEALDPQDASKDGRKKRPVWPAWIPFGYGIRRCIGIGFAPLLIERVLRELIKGVELELVDDRAPGIQLRAGALVVPRHEVRVRALAAQHAPADRALSPALPGSR